MGGLRIDDAAAPSDAESSSLLRGGGKFTAEVETGGLDAVQRRRPGAALRAKAKAAFNTVSRAWGTAVQRAKASNLSRPVVLAGLGVGVLTLVLGVYVLVSGPSTGNLTPAGELRVALLADAHLIGPQYVCCTESNDVDNDSIMKTVERLKAAQQQIEALDPPPAGVVFLGDVIHNGYFSHNFDWYLQQRNAYTVGGEVFANFTRPVRFLWGNHDYKTTCGSAADSYDRFSLSHRLFKHFLGPTAMPYSSFKVGRYNLLFLNAQLGPSWDPTHPRCDTRLGSLGAPQLEWLARELGSGRPAFVFLHHPLPATLRDEAPELPLPDLLSTLLAHRDNVMAVFSGHYHRGLDWADAYPFPALTLPATRYDADNWFLLGLPVKGPPRSWRLLDGAKNKGGARCSQTWAYTPGGADPVAAQPQPEETGSCGSPTLEEVGKVVLPPVKDVSDIPGPSGRQFNPEAPCALAYMEPVLDRCLKEGSSPGCCAVLGEHLRPSSAAYGASCMCWPPFWKKAQALFSDHGRNVSQLLGACAEDHAKLLQWPGAPGGACMEPGSSALPPSAPEERRRRRG